MSEEVWGVIRAGKTDGAEWLDVGTLRYTKEGARLAANEADEKAGREWKEANRPVRIVRYTLTKARKSPEPTASHTNPFC